MPGATYDLNIAAAAVTGNKRLPFAYYTREGGDLLAISANIASVIKNISVSKPVFQGVCYRETDTLVFATKEEPRPARKGMLTRVLKNAHYAHSAEIDLRQLGPGEPDGTEEPGATTAATPVAPPAVAASPTPPPAPPASAAVPPSAPSDPTPKDKSERSEPLKSPAIGVEVLIRQARGLVNQLPSANPAVDQLRTLVEAAAGARDLDRLNTLVSRMGSIVAKQAAEERERQQAEELRGLVARAADALKKLPAPDETKAKLAALIRSAFEQKDSFQLKEMTGKFEAATLKVEAKAAADKEATEKAAQEAEAKAAAERARAQREAEERAAAARVVEQARVQREAEEERARVQREADERARREAAEKAQQEAEEKAAAEQAEAERVAAAAQREAEERAQQEAEQAQREADEEAQREAEETARETAEREASQRTQQEAAAEAEPEAAEEAEEAEEAASSPAAGGHREVAAKLSRSLNQEDMDTLDGLPPEIAASLVGVLETTQNTLAPGKSFEDTRRQIAEVQPQIAKARREAEEADAEYNKARKLYDAAAVGTPQRNAAGARMNASIKAENDANQKIADLSKTTALFQADSRLRGALRFSPVFRPPVNPDHVAGLSPARKDARHQQNAARQRAVATILSHFNDHPELAVAALDILPGTEHPEAVAAAIPVVGTLRAGNFAGRVNDPDQCAQVANNALKMAGTVGGDFSERLAAYYASEAPKEDDALHAGSKKQKALNYTTSLAGAMLGDGGSVQVDAEALGAVRDQLHFHPQSLLSPMLNLARHVEKVRTDLRNPEIEAACNQSLRALTIDPEGEMAPVVRATLGLADNAAVDAQVGRQAVLSAALTPLTQGGAGSCFATCNCMDYQEHHPDKFLGDLCELVGTSALAKDGLSAPVVTNVAAGENKLLRGLEYTVASLAASKDQSTRKNNLAIHMKVAFSEAKNLRAFREMTPTMADLHQRLTAAETAVRDAESAYDTNRRLHEQASGNRRSALAAELPGLEADRDAKRRTAANLKTAADNAADAMAGVMAEATRAALAFDYDPTMTPTNAQRADDGNSTAGGWSLKSAETGERIEEGDLTTLKQCLVDKILRSLPAGSTAANVETVVGSGNFLNKLRAQYAFKGEGDARKATGSIFNHREGGFLKDSKELLAGAGTETVVIVATSAAGANASDKVKALLVGLVDSTKDLGPKEVSLEIDGVHGERAIPTHPTLDALKAGGSVADNADAVFAKTRLRAQKELDPEEVQHFLGKVVQEGLKPFLNGADPGLDLTRASFAGSMKPVDLKRAMIAAVPIRTLVAVHGKENPRTKAKELTAAARTEVMRQMDEALDSVFVRELFPEFVVADTNWGDADSKTFHIVSADLETGEPKLFSKDGVTGALTPADSGFLNAAWNRTTTRG